MPRRKKAKADVRVFIRTCSLDRFATKDEAVAHTREQAAAARMNVTTHTAEKKMMLNGNEAWVVTFKVEAPSAPKRKREAAPKEEVVEQKRVPRKKQAAPSKTDGIVKHDTGGYRWEFDGVRYRTKRQAEEAMNK